MYKISSFANGEPNCKRLYPDEVTTYEEATVLLNKFKTVNSQSGNSVSEIQNDSFSCIDGTLKNERIFQIEKLYFSFPNDKN